MIFIAIWGFLLVFNFYNSLNRSSETSILSLIFAMISSMLLVMSIYQYNQKKKLVKDKEEE